VPILSSLPTTLSFFGSPAAAMATMSFRRGARAAPRAGDGAGTGAGAGSAFSLSRRASELDEGESSDEDIAAMLFASDEGCVPSSSAAEGGDGGACAGAGALASATPAGHDAGSCASLAALTSALADAALLASLRAIIGVRRAREVQTAPEALALSASAALRG
jgi:hypothetical protein